MRRGLASGVILGLSALALLVSTAGAAVVLGDQAVEPSVDYNPAGVAEAFKTTASASATVTTLNVYLDAGSTASKVTTGFYADASGHPGSLLAQGSTTTPAAGAWNAIPVPGFSVASGTSYWIALLGPSGSTGTIKFRDRCCGGGSAAETGSQTGLTALPQTWATKTTYLDGPFSAYASSATGPVLSVSPASLSFRGVQGGASPPTQQVTISNTGDSALLWTATPSASWLSAVPATGTAPSTPSIAASTAGLAPGTYTGSVTIDAGTAQGSPQTVNVTLTVTPADSTPPTVSISSPAAGAQLSGTVNVTANASDNVGVAGVQFKLDGANLGSEDTAAPYSVPWDTTQASNTGHTLSAVARDAAGNTAPAADVVVTVSNTGPPPVTGLVAAYAFDEASGTTVSDASGNGNTGTISNAAWNANGRFGSALDFNGSNSYVTVPDSSSLDLTNGMTLEAWVKPAQLGTTNWRTVVLKQNSANSYFTYALYANNNTSTPSGHVYVGGDVDTRGASQLPLNAWTHLAATYDGSTLRIYVNGTLASSKAIAGSMLAGTGVLRIGGNSIWSEWFSGLIDEVRVYNRALSGSELQTDMNTAVAGGAPGPPPPDPSKIGQWAGPFSWPLVTVHASLLPTGNVLVFDGFAAGPNSQRVWNPATGQFTPVPYGENTFCAGHVLLADGRTLIVGGHVRADVGLPDTNLFNADGTWTRVQDMSVGRWYPTATELPDGKVLVFSGDNIVQDQPGQPHALTDSSVDSLPEVFDPRTNTWTDLNNSRLTSALYPFMFVLPNGKVFDAGPDTQSRILDPATWTWSNSAVSPFDAMSAVQYRPGLIMKSGSWADPDFKGSLAYNATNRTAVIDMNQPSPQWRETSPMAFPRAYHNLTLLPDGTVLASGGLTISDGIDLTKSVLPAEIWNPDTQAWTTVASEQIGRGYHSTALLLPDGRVLMAGGGQLPNSGAIDETNAEIYSPPYLFKGARPTISSAPAVIQYGSSFTVQTPDAANITKVSLIRTPSVTHAFDQNQRFQWLNFTAGSGSLTVQAPADGNVAPPGYYLLFVDNGNGVPSVASFVRIPAPWEDTQAPTSPSALGATPGTSSVALSWTGSTDNVGVARYDVYRSTTSGFTPSLANRIAQPTGTSYTDTGLAPGT